MASAHEYWNWIKSNEIQRDASIKRNAAKISSVKVYATKKMIKRALQSELPKLGEKQMKITKLFVKR